MNLWFVLAMFVLILGSVFAAGSSSALESLRAEVSSVSHNMRSLTQEIAFKSTHGFEALSSFIELDAVPTPTPPSITQPSRAASPTAAVSTTPAGANPSTTTVASLPKPSPPIAPTATTVKPLATTGTSGDGDVGFLTAKLEFSTSALAVVLMTALFIGMALGAAYRSYAVQNRSMSSTRAKYRAFAG